MVGQTAGKVYPLLQGLGGELTEVRDEATADSLVEEIARQRGRAKTDVDRRALDLLEMQVERRPPRCRISRARTAIGPWPRGAVVEGQMVAGRAAADGRTVGRVGKDHASRPGRGATPRIKSLHQMAARRLDRPLANRPRPGRDVLEPTRRRRTPWTCSRPRWTSIRPLAAACCRPVPTTRSPAPLRPGRAAALRPRRGDPLRAIETPGQPGAGLLAHRSSSTRLYESAISRDGEVSLGRGAALYEAVQQKLLEELKTADQGHRPAVVEQLLRLYRAAHRKEFPGVEGDLHSFAFQAAAGTREAPGELLLRLDHHQTRPRRCTTWRARATAWSCWSR